MSTTNEITINVKGEIIRMFRSKFNSCLQGPSELKLQITIATDKSVNELKQAIASQSEVPADKQRLIYSGRVLKVLPIHFPKNLVSDILL